MCIETRKKLNYEHAHILSRIGFFSYNDSVDLRVDNAKQKMVQCIYNICF